jgi:two-component SAPR family response regulator
MILMVKLVLLCITSRGASGMLADSRDKPGLLVYGLGRFDLVINSHSVSRWRAGKARNLLQFMLLRQGRIVSREVLYNALWPDKNASSDSSSLKVAVHMLRGVIGADRRAARHSSSICLETCDAGYILHTDNVWIDFEIFDRLIDDGHHAQARGDTAATASAFREAMELYQGDFLPNVGMDWADMHREWLRSRALLALEWLTVAELRADDKFAIIHWSKRTLEIDPYREEAYRALMHVHAQLGHLNQVRRWYDLCCTNLKAGLDLVPAPSTRELLAKAMRGDLVSSRRNATMTN